MHNNAKRFSRAAFVVISFLSVAVFTIVAPVFAEYPKNLIAVSKLHFDATREPIGLPDIIKTNEGKAICAGVAAFFGIEPEYVLLAIEALPTATKKGQETFYDLPVQKGYVYCGCRIMVHSLNGNRTVINGSIFPDPQEHLGIYTFTPPGGVGEGSAWVEGDAEVYGILPEYYEEFKSRGVCASSSPATRLFECRKGDACNVNHGDMQKLSQFLQSTPPSSSSPSWSLVPGAAVDVGIGADGTTWVIGTNSVEGGFGIYRWSGNDWVNVPGGATNVAVDPNGNPWVVNNAGNIFRGDKAGNWVQMPGAAVDVGVGADGTTWVIGTNSVGGGFGIYRWNGNNWVNVPGGAVRISVDPNGNPWVVNNAGNIFCGDKAGNWHQVPGAAVDVGIGANGTVYVIGTNSTGGGYGIYRWNGSNWDAVPGGAVRVAVNPNGFPWVTNSARNIFRWR